jgi:hypothetical protein
MCLTCRYVDPPIGIEAMTYALRGARSRAAHALAAPIARGMARIALSALGLSGDPVHEPVHVRRSVRPLAVRATWSVGNRELAEPRTKADGEARHGQ